MRTRPRLPCLPSKIWTLLRCKWTVRPPTPHPRARSEIWLTVCGRCGNATAFCTTGCQSGPCLVASTVISSSRSATPTPTNKPGTVSPDGACGYNDAFTCKGSKFGICCSAAGYCGATEYECSHYLGCQPSFGQCNQTVTTTTSMA
ncbi:carbohydrate-binding module family 18 protein [Amniculicola lignicola CBS 123094]|uniref:Carbohydrate-binding module family 18 protein n=1 Tax=Amniculicola lignicola CBS 123094 TaxID=1392246 RepID=A0A6A5WA44_9PLEO|nr:carbohydrate-binding module family 18 protein [Amniculicola lignicola CBS 123094]